MSIRRRILKELRTLHRDHPGDFILIDSTNAFIKTPIKDRQRISLVLNQLLYEQLIILVDGPPGLGGRKRGQIRINGDKLDAIDKELSFDWKWAAGIAIAALGSIAAFLALRHSN